MPDWSEAVTGNLGRLRLSAPARQEVIAELAAHMEDSYEADIIRGATPEDAQHAALQTAGDWSLLLRGINQTREDYMSRTRTLWLPGLASLVIGMLVQATLARIGPRPAVWMFSNTALIIQWWWIASLPFAGAAGAYLCRRNGGTVSERLTSALFPALFMAGLLALAYVVSSIVDFGRVPFSLRTQAMALFMLGWAIVPAPALLLGALPFLGDGSHHPAPAAH